VCLCAYHCAQLSYITQHRAVLLTSRSNHHSSDAVYWRREGPQKCTRPCLSVRSNTTITSNLIQNARWVTKQTTQRQLTQDNFTARSNVICQTLLRYLSRITFGLCDLVSANQLPYSMKHFGNKAAMSLPCIYSKKYQLSVYLNVSAVYRAL